MRRVEPTLSSEDDWYRHYDLDRDPFAEGGVQGLFYPGGARQETVEQLQHLARFSDCVLLVTGIPGMGKTATRRHFVAQSASDTRCCVLEAALLEGPEPWLRRVLSGFGLRSQPRAGTDADLQQLVQFCADRLAAGSQSWLVIDDAQHMHEDVLQFLPRLLQAAGRNLRVVLFAEPDWREQLQSVMPSGVPLHTIELQPLERGETYAYIHYRMNTAGLEGESPFNAAELEQIHRNADGIPAEINAEARAALLGGIKVVQEPLNSLPMWHFGVIAATLLALLLLYAWTGMNESEQQPPVPIPGLAPVTELDTGEGRAMPGSRPRSRTPSNWLPTALRLQSPPLALARLLLPPSPMPVPWPRLPRRRQWLRHLRLLQHPPLPKPWRHRSRLPPLPPNRRLWPLPPRSLRPSPRLCPTPLAPRCPRPKRSRRNCALPCRSRGPACQDSPQSRFAPRPRRPLPRLRLRSPSPRSSPPLNPLRRWRRKWRPKPQRPPGTTSTVAATAQAAPSRPMSSISWGSPRGISCCRSWAPTTRPAFARSLPVQACRCASTAS